MTLSLAALINAWCYIRSTEGHDPASRADHREQECDGDVEVDGVKGLLCPLVAEKGVSVCVRVCVVCDTTGDLVTGRMTSPRA